MIQAMKGRGAPRAKAVCDTCGREEVCPCSYLGADKPHEGQIVKRLTQQNWSSIKGVLRCPTCEAKRKVVPMKTKTVISPEAPRQPTRQEKREIVQMLEVAYDVSLGRYKGADTDLTVAEVLRVMPGWVAEIREDLFGPDGGNDEIEALAEDIAKLAAQFSTALAEFEAEVTAKISSAQKDLTKRLDKVRAAVGPRAGHL